MTRLAQAVRAASEDALTKVSLEALATEMATEQVSMEQHIDDLNALTTMASGLDSVVASFESIESPTPAQRSHARDQALTLLTMSGLSAGEANEIFPSLEAEGETSAWQKFKDFVVRMWGYIKEVAARIYEFVVKVLQQSSIAEKAAMNKLRLLRQDLRKIKAGVTIQPQLPLRPAHRYILDSQNHVDGLSGLKRNIDTFIEGRDAVQDKLPKVIRSVCEKMVEAVDALALKGDDAQISASIAKNGNALRDAAAPMFPEALARMLGFNTQQIPLINDRVITVNQPVAVRDELITDEQVAAHISQFGITVDQIQVPAVNAENMGSFPALRTTEIEELLKVAERLIDTGHSAEQQRQWKQLHHMVKTLNFLVNGVIVAIVKKPGLSPEARVQMKMVLNASRAANNWVAAPFMQLNTINVRVVNSVLSLAEDQIKNYELADSMQERADKAAIARKNEEKKDKK